MTLDLLPPHMRRQAEEQMGIAQATQPTPPTGGTPRMKRKIRVRTPNKTEAAFNQQFLQGKGQYEALTFTLPGGARYTPDFIQFTPKGIWAYEVKGSYKLHSHGRALVAFRVARAHFRDVQFHWFEKSQDGTFEEKYIKG